MTFARARQGVGLAAVLLALVPLAGCGGSSSAAAAEPGGARTCASPWLGTELPAGATVELLVAAGDTIPAGRWGAYKAMAGAVAACAGPGAALTLRPITNDSLTQLPLFSAAVPLPAGQNAVNPLRYRADMRGFVVKAAAAVDRLPELARGVRGSDPLGAMQAAGQDLELGTTVTVPPVAPPQPSTGLSDSRASASGTPAPAHVIVAIFNGWQQTRALNLFRYGHDPSGSTATALAALRASGALPELHGSDVVIVGLTPGDARMQTSDAQLSGLCRFWRAVVEAGHGTLKRCAGGLPGISQGS